MNIITQISKKYINRVFLSKPFFVLLFISCTLFVTFGKEVEGAMAFILLICVLLIVCEDLMSTTLPFMLLCTFVLSQYDSYETFIKFKWMVIPLVFALIFHFIVYFKPIVIGSSFLGNFAVAIAVTLGGIGSIAASDYFSPASIYYITGLGFGMLLVYIYIKPGFCAVRDKIDAGRLFAGIMYLTGIFACFMVLRYYAINFDSLIDSKDLVSFQSRNNLSTVLMLAMPFPFYFAVKNDLHLFSGLLIFGCIVISGSRGGLLFGTVEFVICLVYMIICNRKKLYYICFSVVLLGFMAYCSSFVLEFYDTRLAEGLFSRDEARYNLIFRAFDDFKASPIFGKGLAYTGNSDLYDPRTFAMNWYHMMLPQIIGSLGLVGILAYGFQLVQRFMTAFRTFDPLRLAMGLSYVGLLLMSQVNPGEFCPLPYELTAVMLFVFLEKKELFVFPKRKMQEVQ